MPRALDDALPHLGDLAVEGGVGDAVGGDELRRDPAGAHRLEDVGVVVRGPVVDDVPVDRDGVVEALVALDELLDRDRRRAVAAEVGQRAARARSSSSTRIVSLAPAPSRGLRISG